MIEFDLYDFRKMVASHPFGYARFTVGDLYLARGEKSRAKEWFKERRFKRFYTASDTLAYIGGTAWTWSDSAGSPTFNLTLANLANGSARQGVKSTTTIVVPPNGGTNAVPPDFFSVQLTASLASTGTTGGEIPVYLAFGQSSSFPGGVSGTDSAYTNTNTFPQLTLCGSLIISADLITNAQQQTPFAIANTDPTNSPYFSPVVFNNCGTALKNTANTSTLTVVSYWRQRAT